MLEVTVNHGDELLVGGALDELGPLWLELYDHHAEVGPGPIIPRSMSWERRRALYEEVLSDPDAFAVVARSQGTAVGYAMVAMHRIPDDSWPTGNLYAEVETLVVSTSARSQGLGNALLDAVDAELARLGITASFIGVMVGNDDAERLYARRGYMPVITKMMRLTEAKPS